MSSSPPKAGLNLVREAFDDAERRMPPVSHGGGGITQEGGGGCLPEDCPVRALGYYGTSHYFMDSMGQLIEVGRKDWNKTILQLLFANSPFFLEAHWPRHNKDGTVNGVDMGKATSDFLYASSQRGKFDINASIRGRGGWRDDHGGFVWNSGQYLYQVKPEFHGNKLERRDVGVHNGIFYEDKIECLRPFERPVPQDQSPAPALLQGLDTWSWERPHFDPLLLIGWVGVAFLGAALHWRPSAFFSGGYGNGKSHLQHTLRALFGKGLIAAGSASPASIYQTIGRDCLPVLLDEFEPTQKEELTTAIIGLMRISASGDVLGKGGADGKPVKYTLRNTFVFSSVNIPPLENTDKSRLAILGLRKLDDLKIAPDAGFKADEKWIENIAHEQWGEKILRQLMDAWETIPAALDLWGGILKRAEFSPRARATYGVLLALSHVLLGDAVFQARGINTTDDPDAAGAFISALTLDEREDQIENWKECFDYLRNSPIKTFSKGDLHTVGAVLARFCGYGFDGDDAFTEKQTRELLAAAGLGICLYRSSLSSTPLWTLAVPLSRNIPALLDLWEKTKWRQGTWVGALKQAPDDVLLHKNHQVKINGSNTRCLLINYAALMEDLAYKAGMREQSPSPEAAKEHYDDIPF